MNYLKLIYYLLICVGITAVIILVTPAKWLTAIAIFLVIYNFILYYDKIRLLWTKDNDETTNEIIEVAQKHGAKLHFHGDLKAWVVLDQPNTPLWEAKFKTKEMAALAFLFQNVYNKPQ
jgi:c-di-AMP phosphodiesterase-like protein